LPIAGLPTKHTIDLKSFATPTAEKEWPEYLQLEIIAVLHLIPVPLKAVAQAPCEYTAITNHDTC
jgi:hypothetical protein